MRYSRSSSRGLRSEIIRRIVWLEAALPQALRGFRGPPARALRLRAGGRVCVVFASGRAVIALRAGGFPVGAGVARVGRRAPGEGPDACHRRTLPVYAQSALSGNVAGSGG